MRRRKNHITFSVKVDDVINIDSDVLLLKYAQDFYGADRAVIERIFSSDSDNIRAYNEIVNFGHIINNVGHKLMATNKAIGAEKVLYISTPSLANFRYGQIRDFARLALRILATEAPKTVHLAATLHGAGYGLDEVEAFESEIAGFVDAIESDDVPINLERITIVEKNAQRARRLSTALEVIVPNGSLSRSTTAHPIPGDNWMNNVGHQSSAKDHVFVAMPFSEDLDDLYHYGIYSAVTSADMLCERSDLSSFTGDVLTQIRNRIASSKFVVAEVTEPNANVYLEIGYAWGCNVPTILITKDPDALKFDVRGQKCLTYKNIKALESSLREELRMLTGNHST